VDIIIIVKVGGSESRGVRAIGYDLFRLSLQGVMLLMFITYMIAIGTIFFIS
jgi:hypothetical protein